MTIRPPKDKKSKEPEYYGMCEYNPEHWSGNNSIDHKIGGLEIKSLNAQKRLSESEEYLRQGYIL